MARQKTRYDIKVTIPNPIWALIRPILPQRLTPLGGGKWRDRDFFNGIVTKFSSKRDWDDLEIFGFPPGGILYQQFIEWRARGVFAVLSDMDLTCDGIEYKFKIEKIISSELPRHAIQQAIRANVDPETIIQPEMNAYPPDEVEAEIETLLPGWAEQSRKWNAYIEAKRRQEFQNCPNLLIERAKSRGWRRSR